MNGLTNACPGNGEKEMARQRPYLVIFHSSVPVKGTPTHIAGWKENGHVRVNEKIELTTRIKNRHLSDASVIIDLLSHEFVKNRFQQEDPARLMDYYFGHYKEKISRYLISFLNEYGTQEDRDEFFHMMGDSD